MSDTDGKMSDAEFEKFLGETKVQWTRPTEFEMDAQDAMRAAHALVHSSAGEPFFGRMYCDLGTKFIAQMIPQAGKEKVRLTAWDGEWAMCADAFRKVHRQSVEYEHLVKKEASLEDEDEANRLIEMCKDFSKRAAQSQQDGMKATSSTDDVKEETDGTHD